MKTAERPGGLHHQPRALADALRRARTIVGDNITLNGQPGRWSASCRRASAAVRAGAGLRAARLRDRRTDAAADPGRRRLRAADRAPETRRLAPAGAASSPRSERVIPRAFRVAARRQQHQRAAAVRPRPGRQPRAGLLYADRRGQLRAADRVRQRRVAVPRTADRAAQGNRRAPVARRDAGAVVRQFLVESLVFSSSPGGSACCSRSGRCRRSSPRSPAAAAQRER